MTSAPDYNQMYLRALEAARELIEDASARGAKVAEVRTKPDGTLLDIRVRTIEGKSVEFIEVSFDLRPTIKIETAGDENDRG